MEKKIASRIYRYTFMLALLLVSACATIERSEYAMVSTRESGMFYKVEKDIPKKKTIAKQPVQSKLDETNLDRLVEQISTPPDHTKFALVIGIRDYQHQANVNYADNSAHTFALAAKHVLGVPNENLFILTNNEATSGQIKTKIAFISELAESRDSIYLYFSGHGVPGKDGNTYLLPADMSADSIHLEPQLRLDNIYKTLNGSAAKQVMIFIDSCFSGRDDKGDLLFRGVAPVFTQKSAPVPQKKLTIMTAGGPSDFANQYEQEHHRLFSYFLIQGLTQDKQDIQELYNYVRRNVKQSSLRLGLGYKQIPQLQVAK